MPRIADRGPSAAVLGLLLIATPVGSAGGADPAPPGRPYVGEERVRVESVNLDVVVLDKKGRRVLDLGPDDFEVTEGGKPVRLDYFHRFLAEHPAEPATSGPVATEPAPAAAPVAQEHRLHLLIVVDDYFTMLANRNRTLSRMGRFLDAVLASGGDVMVVTAARRLRIEQSFTRDPESIRQALARTQQTGSAETVASDQRDFAGDAELAVAAADPRQTLPFEGVRTRARAEADELLGQVRATIQMLETCVDALAGLPGRKVLLLISDGFPEAPGQQQLMTIAANPRLRRRRANPLADTNAGIVREDLARLARLANGNRVTFYTLRSFGLGTDADVEAAAPVAGDGMVDRDLARLLESGNVKAPLGYLATATGGRALLEGNDVAAFLESSLDDFREYYALGWTRDVPPKSDYARIRVRVRRPGLEVLYRKGHLSKPQDERDADVLRTALLLGGGANPAGIRIVADRAIPEGELRYRVPLLVPVRYRALALVPEGDRYVGGFELLVARIGASRSVLPIERHGFSVVVPRSVYESVASHEYPAMFTLVLDRGTNVLAVALRDDHGSGLSVTTVVVDLGRPAAASAGGGG